MTAAGYPSTMPAAPPAASVSMRLRLAVVAGLAVLLMGAVPSPTAAADPTPSVDPAATPTADPTATPTADPTPTQTPDPTPAPTAEPTLTTAATPTPTADPTASPTPDPTPSPDADPTPTPAPTPMIVTTMTYRGAAMTRQYTGYWCVPAATMTMLNLIRGTNDRSYATQRRYYYATRVHNRYRYSTLGNDPQGWSWALRYYSRGRTNYLARMYTNKTLALQAIMSSIDRTHQPVGVPVRRGTHAWVVLGYRAAVDPVDPTKRTLLGFYVSGPLGTPKDPWLYRYMTLATFGQYFYRYHEWQRRVIWEGRWVIISQ